MVQQLAADELKRRLLLEETLKVISSRFVRVDDIDRAIEESLADMGHFSGASRAYLFVFRCRGTVMDNTHE